MANPFYGVESPTNSTQPTKAVNRQGVFTPRTHNTFDMSYFNYKTQIFGKYEPFFCMEAVPGDKIPLASSHTIRSFPFISPMLSNLTLHKDNFLIPMQAILPNTWEYIYKNPSQGDDVPDDANCLLPLYSMDDGINFPDVTLRMLERYLRGLNGFLTSLKPDHIKILVAHLFSCELFFSSSCLLNQLGFKMSPIFHIAKDGKHYFKSFDSIFDEVMHNVISHSNFEVKYSDIVTRKYTIKESFSPEYQRITPAAAVSLLRDNLDKVTFRDVKFSESDKFVDIADHDNISSASGLFGPERSNVNISRVIAYQLVCSQFYVNSQVDYIYNAQLYRDNFFSLVKVFASHVGVTNFNHKVFSLNGIQIPYDYFSKYYFGFIFKQMYENISVDVNDTGDSEDIFTSFYNCVNYIFGLRDSLKFGDYFTDCRTRPFAVGTTDVPVVGDKVSAVDVTKSLVMQRFLHNVSKLGNSFSDYLKGIFGTLPVPDVRLPKFISHQEFSVNTSEVANTSDNQGNIVTNLNSSADNFLFTVDIDMPCIIMSISHFSIPRIYSQTKERFFYHQDRFDEFNPMLQFLGDQPIFNCERSDFFDANSNFGYQSRHGEYKQRFSVASGGFVEKLPGWAFITDTPGLLSKDFEILPYQNPDFIRNRDYEFDRFCSVMSGLSLANRFHFIVIYDNKCVANRPLEINPNIL